MCRLSKIDVSPFEDLCVALRRSMSRCVDLRRSMCRLSKIDVSTFGDGCVGLRRPMIDVSTFEDRFLMCRPSNIDDRCEIRLLYLLNTRFRNFFPFPYGKLNGTLSAQIRGKVHRQSAKYMKTMTTVLFILTHSYC